MSDSTYPIPLPSVSLVQESEVPTLLAKIRPQWQAKKLIDRVRRLLAVDPSSACQRVFNASMHDLVEKIKIAGIDIAEDVTKLYKLPPVTKAEDLDHYPVSKIIELAYRIGLLSKPEWRRISRCYEIRSDLEHEDNEYEAGIEDCIYIFKTCIEAILARDPIQSIKISDVKDLISQPVVSRPSEELIEDYKHAPETRQEEICKFLISHSLKIENADIIQQNSFNFLAIFSAHSKSQVVLNLATFFSSILKRKGLDPRHARVALAAGVFPYLRIKQRTEFYESFFAQMEKVGSHWDGYHEHGELLRSFRDCGGLEQCPESVRVKIVKWMILTYIGTPGGVTSWGNTRHVFYSNTAAPIIREFFQEASSIVKDDIVKIRKSKEIKLRCENQHIARRFEGLIDIIENQ